MADPLPVPPLDVDAFSAACRELGARAARRLDRQITDLLTHGATETAPGMTVSLPDLAEDAARFPSYDASFSGRSVEEVVAAARAHGLDVSVDDFTPRPLR